MKPRTLFFLIAAGLIMLTPGCSIKPDKISYYQLAARADIAAADTGIVAQSAIGIGPITIPEMLKRQEIVLADSGNRYTLADKHRWAGLLEKDIAVAVRENLSTLLNSQQIFTYPWPGYINPGHQVRLELLQLTGQLGGSVSLKANWSIIDQKSMQAIVRKSSHLILQADKKTMDALVEAQNQLLLQLCQQISAAVLTLF